MARAEITCVGDVTQDELLLVQDGIAGEDDLVLDRAVSMGGAGLVAAVTLSGLGVRPNLVTVLPDTAAGREQRLFLEGQSVDTRGLETNEYVVEHGRTLAIQSDLGGPAKTLFIPGDGFPQPTVEQSRLVAGADIVYFTRHPQEFNYELSALTSTEAQVVSDLALYAKASRSSRRRILSLSKVLIGNEHEVADLVEDLSSERQYTPQLIVDEIPNLHYIIETRGVDEGRLYRQFNDSKTFGVRDAQVANMVGAGSAFAAGVIYGMEREWSMLRSAEFASHVAAIAVASETSYPHLEHVRLLAEQYAD